MLGQEKKHAVPGWGIILVACLLLLVAVSLFVRETAPALNLNLVDRGMKPQASTASLPQPSVDVLRAARPTYSGGFVPESTMGDQAVSVDVLRAAKPAYSGGAVPESTIGRERSRWMSSVQPDRPTAVALYPNQRWVTRPSLSMFFVRPSPHTAAAPYLSRR